MGGKHSKRSKKQRASDAAAATITMFYELANFGHLLDPKADSCVASVDVLNSEHNTPLFLTREARVAALLLERGADVNARSKTNETPLIAAARYNTAEVVALLLDHGADVHAADKYGATALHEATSVEVAQMLLKHGADVNALDQYGCPPLFTAVKNGSLGVTTALLDAGADIAQLNDSKESVVYAISRQTTVATMEVLLERGATLSCSSLSAKSPLHAAVDAGAIGIVRFLIDRGHPVDLIDGLGWTPLHVAASHNYLEILKLLLEHGASVRGDGAPERGLLASAALQGNLLVMAELLAHGAQFEATSCSPASDADKRALTAVAPPAQIVQVIIENYATIARAWGFQPLYVFDRWLTKMKALSDETKEAKAASKRLIQRFESIVAQLRNGSIPSAKQNTTAFAHMLLRPWKWMHEYAMKSVSERVAETVAMFDDFASFHHALDAIQGWFTLTEGDVAGYKQRESSLHFYSWSLSPELRRERDAFMASELRGCADDRQTFWRRMHVVAIGLMHLHQHGCVHGALVSWSDDPLMIAPEVRHATTPASSAADVYSFGRAMLHGLSHGAPWKGVSADVARVLASTGRLPSRPESIGKEQWQLIERMCMSDPVKRPAIGDVLEQFTEFAASEQAPAP